MLSMLWWWLGVIVGALGIAYFLTVQRRWGRGAAGHAKPKDHRAPLTDRDGDLKQLRSASLSPSAAATSVIRQTIKTAARFVRPFLRVETELERGDGYDSDIIGISASENGGRGGRRGSSGLLSPLTAERFKVTKQRRAMANAHIRRRLEEVPADEMAAPFKVHACTWNVDQCPPPEYSTAFLTWLLGSDLATKVEKHRVKRQRILDPQAPPQPRSKSSSGSPLSGASTALPLARSQTVDLTQPTAERRSGRLPPRRSPPQRQTEPSPPQGLSAAGEADAEVREAQAATVRRLARSDVSMAQLLQEFPDLIVITLQEVDMGGVALVKESTFSSVQWTEAIVEALHLAADRQLYYKRLKVVQLVGLILIVLVQARHADYTSHVRLSLTRTGAMRVLGNKGSVAMRATIYGKRFLFITAHFAAHKHNEHRRMFNYHAALNDLRFDMPAFTDDESEVLRTFVDANANTSSMIDSFVAGRSAWERLFRVFEKPPSASDVEARVLDEHDYIFFLGDLNSRLHAVDGAEIRERVKRGELDQLLIHDEVRQGMVYGEAFDGFEEQWIRFPPTYKFDRGTSVYDTSRKKRDPAWCDRVLFRVLDPAAPTSEPVGSSEKSSAFFGDHLFPHHESSRDLKPAESETRSPVKTLSAEAGGAPHEGGKDARASRMNSPLSHSQLTQEWVALGDIQNLGFEACTSISSDVGRFTGEDSLSAAVAAVRSSSAVGEANEAERNALAAAHAAASSSTDSISAGSVHSPQEEAAGSEKSCSTRTAWTANSKECPVPPSHPVWEQKQCEETFKAARRPFDVRFTPLRFPMIPNHVHPLEYFSVGELKRSDHRPVCARFEVKVIALKQDLVSDILDDLQQTIWKDAVKEGSSASTPAFSSSGSFTLEDMEGVSGSPIQS